MVRPILPDTCHSSQRAIGARFCREQMQQHSSTKVDPYDGPAARDEEDRRFGLLG